MKPPKGGHSMSDFECLIKQLKNIINFTMKSLDKIISKMPSDQLFFKPTEDVRSFAELSTHVYDMAYVYMLATKNGRFSKEDWDLIPFDYIQANSAEEIVEYGQKVKQYMMKIINELTVDDLQKKITYEIWNNFQLTGFDSLSTILTEVPHHRGQLCVYLRMLGIKPPSIYDFS